VTYYPKDGLVYQLTWTNNVLLVYSGLMTNPNMKLQKIREILFPDQIQEGWGDHS
jgi:hypothetical protein